MLRARQQTAEQDDDLADDFYVRPTVFADVRNDMRIANDSTYGLSGGVWTAGLDSYVEYKSIGTGPIAA